MVQNERIVITGTGVVSLFGSGSEVLHDALLAGRSNLSKIRFPWDTAYREVWAGRIPETAGPTQTNGMGRASWLALKASQLAWTEAGFDVQPPLSHRTGVVAGTAFGDAVEFEEQWLESNNSVASTNGDPRSWMRLGSMVSRIADAFGLEGPSHLAATTCAAGNHAISWCADLLKAGKADAMLAVAADTLGFVDVLGFTRLLLQAPKRCQPFDLHRKGTILSEGAGALVLERLSTAKRRGAVILAEVAGCGLSCDASGPFSSRVDNTRALHVAAERALRNARLSPDAIEHVSSHGSGTKLNDLKETVFLKQLLGRRAYDVPISGIKSMLGHAQGASSMIEAIASVLTLRRDVIYPTTNYETADPACDLDYVPNIAREQRVQTIMSNAFGVGGNNAIAVFRRWGD